MEIVRQLVAVARVKIALRNVENFEFFFLGDLFGHVRHLNQSCAGKILDGLCLPSSG